MTKVKEKYSLERIQKQLDDVVTKLEDIFRMMQEECEKSFEEVK